MPKVSVIIPNYNHAPYLPKRIESVLMQTWQDFELILMDDCSSDNSKEIIERYAQKDNRIKTYYNISNSGSTFKQWNKGIQLSRGEYIWIAESDDYADEKLLETLVSQLDQYPSAGIAYCQSWMIDERDTILHSVEQSTIKIDKERWKHNFFNSGVDECRNYLIIQNTIPNASAVLFRKNIYEKAGFADENLRLAGDWMQWAKMLLISDIAFAKDHLNYFRMHTTTTRHASYKDFKELVEYYQVLKFITEHISIDPNVLKNFFLHGKWQLVAKTPLNKKALINMLYIFRMARIIDPLIYRRLYRYFKARLFQ